MLFSKRTLVLAPGLVLALAIVFACSGGGDEAADSGTATPSGAAREVCGSEVVNRPFESDIFPVVVSSQLSVGRERFVVGIYNDEEAAIVPGATLHLKFICYDTPEGTPAFEAEPETIVLTKTYTHTHEDGTVETHSAGETGAYVAYVEFDRPGYWGVEVTGTLPDGTELEPMTVNFAVNEDSVGLDVGDPAPASVQTLVSDVPDIRLIDTSDNPIPEQHSMTIADAIKSGKPTVIAFATPAFCQTQICGPIKEIFDDLYYEYSDRANFIHIEPYDVERMRSGGCAGDLASCLSPVVTEWGLESEPWVFIVDAQGRIAAKFDGIASREEIEAALGDVLVQ